MAMDKMNKQIIERLERIERKLDRVLEDGPAASVTKEQLTAIKGVGPSTADEILALLNG